MKKIISLLLFSMAMVAFVTVAHSTSPPVKKVVSMEQCYAVPVVTFDAPVCHSSAVVEFADSGVFAHYVYQSATIEFENQHFRIRPPLLNFVVVNDSFSLRHNYKCYSYSKNLRYSKDQPHRYFSPHESRTDSLPLSIPWCS